MDLIDVVRTVNILLIVATLATLLLLTFRIKEKMGAIYFLNAAKVKLAFQLMFAAIVVLGMYEAYSMIEEGVVCGLLETAAWTLFFGAMVLFYSTLRKYSKKPGRFGAVVSRGK